MCDKATTFQSAPDRDIKAVGRDRELRELFSPCIILYATLLCSSKKKQGRQTGRKQKLLAATSTYFKQRARERVRE